MPGNRPPLTWSGVQKGPGGRLPGTIAEFGEIVPYHRAGQPVEIAPVYVALASADIRFALAKLTAPQVGTVSDSNVVFVTRNVSLGADYFDRLYAASADPWQFETSEYEKDKYRATVEALGSMRFRDALEIGCSIGVLTSLLADRCERLLSIDVSSDALQSARVRCHEKKNVAFAQMQVPNEFPPGKFDLIVLSEVGYYLSRADLQQSIDKIAAAAQRGIVELVHYLPKVHDYPLSGDDVHDTFLADRRFKTLRSDRTEKYRLDILTL